jgi:molybdate transport system substrate-binding protein
VTRSSPLAFVFALLVLVVGLVGCGSSDKGSANQSITVFAASSLKKPFTEIGERFKTDNPGSSVELNFAGSADLVVQLVQGASADVFASADTNNMVKAEQAELVEGKPVAFASNTLTIVTAPGNAKQVTSFADLTKPGLSVVVCAAEVPCGAATEKVEKATNTVLQPVSEESSVTDVLNKVTSGQADAGVVYVTDALAAGDKVAAVNFPESSAAVNTYPIAVLKGAPKPDVAKKFVDLVTGEYGQKVLSEAGFAKP